MSDAESETRFDEPTRAMRERLREYIGETLDDFDAVAARVSQLRFDAPPVGEVAPGFSLPDARGGERTLDELCRSGPVVVVFYRGSWCPYCNLQLRAFQGALDEIEELGATLVAISPQSPDGSLSTAELSGLGYAVLSDRGAEVAARYGLVFALEEAEREVHRGVGVDLAEWNGDGEWRLPAAATFVVDRDGTVAFASVSSDYRTRAGPEEVLEALRSLGGRAPASGSDSGPTRAPRKVSETRARK